MKAARLQKKTTRRAPTRKPRKNARSNEIVSVIPDGGLDAWNAKIGDLWKPLDFRALIDEARISQDGLGVDKTFKKIVSDKTAQQIQELLKRLGLKPTDPEAYGKAFTILAMVFCGIGQVTWRPRPTQSESWTPRHAKILFWLVKSLCEREGLSERKAIAKITADKNLQKFFPYQSRGTSCLNAFGADERRFQSLWQAWMKAKRKKEQLIAEGPPRFLEAFIGNATGFYETKLIELDVNFARSQSGKNRTK